MKQITSNKDCCRSVTSYILVPEATKILKFETDKRQSCYVFLQSKSFVTLCDACMPPFFSVLIYLPIHKFLPCYSFLWASSLCLPYHQFLCNVYLGSLNCFILWMCPKHFILLISIDLAYTWVQICLRFYKDNKYNLLEVFMQNTNK